MRKAYLDKTLTKYKVLPNKFFSFHLPNEILYLYETIKG